MFLLLFLTASEAWLGDLRSMFTKPFHAGVGLTIKMLVDKTQYSVVNDFFTQRVARTQSSSWHGVFEKDGFFFKPLEQDQDEEHPENEFICRSLYRLLGCSDLIAPTTLIEISTTNSNRGKTYQVSPKVGDRTLADILSSRIRFEIPFENYSWHFIMTLLLNLGDAKAENYVVNENGQLISIDHEMALRPPVVNCYEGRGNLAGIISILFCFQHQMDRPIYPSVRDKLLTVDPYQIVHTWQTEIAKHRTVFSRSIQDKEIESFRVLACLQGIQLLLRKKMNLTHQDLLRNYLPRICEYYEKIRTRKKDALQAIKHVIYKESQSGLTVPTRGVVEFFNDCFFIDGRELPEDAIAALLGALRHRTIRALLLFHCRESVSQLQYGLKTEQLTMLELVNCNLRTEHLGYLSKNIVTLNISDNPLESITDKNLHLPFLRQLTVSNCQRLRRIRLRLPNLNTLICEFNQELEPPEIAGNKMERIYGRESRFLAMIQSEMKGGLAKTQDGGDDHKEDVSCKKEKANMNESEGSLSWSPPGSCSLHSIARLIMTGRVERTLELFTAVRRQNSDNDNGIRDMDLFVGKVVDKYGNVNVLFDYGMSYMHDGDYAKAKKWFQEAAIKNHAEAQNNLGWLYETGRGVTKNFLQAIDWYAKSAARGNTYAQFNLGWMYETGKGVLQDFKKALELYTQAAEQNDPGAQLALGLIYETGRGVPRNLEQAEAWYAHARLNETTKGDAVKSYYEASANEADDANAKFWLGWIYEHGRCIDQNNTIATEWYKKAAEQGHEEAKSRLEEINTKQDEAIRQRRLLSGRYSKKA